MTACGRGQRGRPESPQPSRARGEDKDREGLLRETEHCRDLQKARPIKNILNFEALQWHCQSKILNTWSGHRTAQIDPEKCRKINDHEIGF